ncbi:MAG: helix-turn-helix domain-containing protein [bacterium]|nr:helix-turn-helix domain-containing protein [bacterium]MCX7917320.1 helix-turn-helix domain-containing protein [bacterium]MDW8164760.1 helix-turn-helix transcriptional regulator [Candidatus Omnitrophota bacterium]
MKKELYIKKIGEKIRDIRKEKGYTQSELAFRIGRSPNFIGLIERGKKIPSLDTLIKIAEILEVNPSVFFVNFNYKVGKEDILVKKISSILKEGSQKDKKLIYQIAKSIVKGKR